MTKWERLNINDYNMIKAIVIRSLQIGLNINPLTVENDLICVHVIDCRLDLNKLYLSKVADFVHDILGIHENINRETGKINYFVPRSVLEV
jgi:hypothetical protein